MEIEVNVVTCADSLLTGAELEQRRCLIIPNTQTRFDERIMQGRMANSFLRGGGYATDSTPGSF